MNFAITTLLFALALSLIAFGIAIWITYAVIKAAIRDGINESKISTGNASRGMAPIGQRWALVKDDSQPQ